VLAYNSFGVPTEVYVVRISDGKILLQQNHSANLLVDVTASPDGSLIAENSSRSSGYIAGPTAPNTVIRRSSDGSVVKDLDPTYGVLAFSADDSVALVNTSPWASGVATHLALIKVDGGDVVWRYDGGEEYGGALVQPGGSSIAVILTSPSDQSGHPSVDLLVVRADGSSTTIPGKYVRP
jgi:hypothetical protein